MARLQNFIFYYFLSDGVIFLSLAYKTNIALFLFCIRNHNRMGHLTNQSGVGSQKVFKNE